MEKTKRKTAIEAIGDVPWGSHFCLFYRTKEDLTDILVPYFKAGLENNEFCMWVTSEALSVTDAKRSLKRVVKNLDDYIEKGQIEILDYSQWYTKSGKFEADKVLQGWVEKENQAANRGFDGLRLTGNTCWLEKEDWRGFTAYEARIDRVIGQYRMLVLCTYSLDKCGASEIIDVVANHELALIRREGKWAIIQSAKRIRAEEALREAETRCRTLIEHIPALTYSVRLDEVGSTLYISPQVERIWGFSPQEWLADPTIWFRQLHPDDRERVVAEYAHSIASAEPLNTEYRILTRDGRVMWGHHEAIVVQDEAGQPSFTHGVVVDITERKRAEEALRESEAKFRKLAEASTGAILIHRGANFCYANPAAERIAGYTHQEFLAMNFYDIVHPDFRELVRQRGLARQRGEDLPPRYEFKIITKSGEERWVEITPTSIEFEGEPAVLSAVFDITDRKRAEEALDYRLEFETLVASISTQFISTTADDIPSRMSDTLSRIAQFVSADRSYVLLFSNDKTKIDDVYEWCAEEIEPHVSRLKGVSVGAFPWLMERMKRSQTLCIHRVADLPHEAGAEKGLLQEGAVQSAVAVPMVLGEKVIGILGFDSVRQEKAWSEDIILLLRIVGQILADVVQRKRAEEALKVSETCYRRLFEAAKDGILLLNAQTGRITDVNPYLVDLLGYSHHEFLGKRIWEIGLFKNIAASQTAFEKLQSEEYIRYENLPLETADGRRIEVEFVSNVYGVDHERVVQCNIRDITERRQAEERLMAYQENLRSLASELSLVEERERRRIASFLHDQIGQSLAAIRMKFAALRQAGGSADIAPMVDEIQALLEWTIRDTRSLTFELSPPILYELGLEAALEWLSERIGEERGIRIEFADDAHSKPLEDDVRGLLFRAVDELLINIVKHANTRSGKVSILRDGDHVRILVEDRGVGFDATTIGSRTSRNGGFGLFSVRERLRYIGGHVEVESERGHGTRVTLIAPLRRDRASLEGGTPCK